MLRRLLVAVLALAAAVALAGGALWLFSPATLKRFAYEGIARDRWQQPERVVEALALAPGMRVADLGSGGGYFTWHFARAVGPSGRVYAADVDADLNASVAERAAHDGLAQVTTVLAAFDDAKLPERVDLVFTCNTYHHIEDRVAYFAQLREKYLASGGRLAVIDFLPEKFSHATDPAVIERELVQAGFRKTAQHDFLERQSFLVFAAE
ncbi:MAG: methyltransferase domain-containing protein [Deltaproteobacteria bacterium]|nr:methyltransferase domain-containing protein [Deltaproteobacteria bacterium]